MILISIYETFLYVSNQRAQPLKWRR